MTTDQQSRSPRVLIFDDERGSATDIKDRLDDIAGLEVNLLENATAEVERLEARRRATRAHNNEAGEDDNAFDLADILIVDYDLTSSDENQSGPAETGERVAYLARCYSRCATIVALNQFTVTATFDLNLIGHISSYADVNISGDQIANPALWGRERQGYAPWSWPDLSSSPTLQRSREAIIAGRFGEAALAVLGLEDSSLSNALTRNQLAWLSPDTSPSKATVEDVIRKGRIGLRPSDEPWGTEGLARVAAARLAKWLERLVLPGQNVLVDAPHLVSRFPSLLTAQELDATTDVGLDASPGLSEELLSSHRYTTQDWLSRRAWLWPTVSEDEGISEVADPFQPVALTSCFTEDSSVFREPQWCRPFAADVEPFSRRFVTRAARAGEDNDPYVGAYGLGRVQYQPQLRFAL
jgi:hypothetical protein